MALKNKRFFDRLSSRVILPALISLFALAMGLVMGVAHASPTTPCDPEYMDALEARAYLEAQREVAQNQNYIQKPDSVLEYTCFDMFLGHFATMNPNWGGTCAAYAFSDSCRWGAVFMQPAGSIWGSINGVVMSALTAYLQGQFHADIPRRYLNGRGTSSYPWPLPVTVGPQPPGPPGKQYTCQVMEEVWRQAHCYNFGEEADHDMFYDFFWYKTPRDPRTMNGDNAWASPANSCAEPINQTNDINVAYNGAVNAVKYGLVNENPWSATSMGDTTVYPNDPVVTHLDLILPIGSPVPPGPAACNSNPPIPTGVCVVRAGWSTAYLDGICPNPGCHYQAPPGPGPGASPAQCPGATMGTCQP